MIASPPSDPTGEQYRIEADTADGLIAATVTQVAAALRALTVGGVDVVQRFPAGAPPSMGAGIVMVPWPNRVRDGRWSDGGRVHQLDISEPERGNSLHGLLRHAPYSVVDRRSDSVALAATIFAPNGYPFVVRSTVRYSVGHGGLTVEHMLENLGSGRAPVAIGTHAYYTIGGVATSDLLLQSSAESVYVDDEQKIPIGIIPVRGDSDLRSPRVVGELSLDHCLTDLVAENGRSRTRLSAADGRSIEVWADESFGHLVILTTSEFVGEAGEPVFALAIEPQTAAVDAFNSGDGLRWLGEGESWAATWGVSPSL